MASRGNANGWQGGSLLGITHETKVKGYKRKQDSQQMALPASGTTTMEL
jgi:hypothetical protein